MPLIVEDGTGVSGANSFVTLTEARDFATLRGIDLPVAGTGDAALTAFLVKGTDYLKSFSYQGTQTTVGEAYLPWPRTGYYVDDLEFDVDTVPIGMKNALIQLAIEQNSGIVLHATATGFAVVREKIGPIDTEYATPKGSYNAAKAVMPAVAAYLKPYLTNIGIRVGRG